MGLTLFTTCRPREDDVLKVDQGLIRALSKRRYRGIGGVDRAVVGVRCKEVVHDFVV